MSKRSKGKTSAKAKGGNFQKLPKNESGESQKPELKKQNGKMKACNFDLVHFCTNSKFSEVLIKYRIKAKRKLAWCKNAPMVQKFAKFYKVTVYRKLNTTAELTNTSR